MAVGYKHQNHLYCVAPVTSTGVTPTLVQYWAAGIDCCSTRGGFSCDDAADLEIRSAAVLLRAQDHGLFLREVFEGDAQLLAKARRKAEGTFGMPHTFSPKAIFVPSPPSPRIFPCDAPPRLWRIAGVSRAYVMSQCLYVSV